MFLDDDGHFRGRELAWLLDEILIVSALIVLVALWAIVQALIARQERRRRFLREYPFSADGRMIATARGLEGARTSGDVATGASIASVDARPGEEDPNDTVALSPDGRTLAVGGWTSVVRLIDVRTGKLLHELDLAGRGRSRSSSPQTAEPSPSRAGRTWRPFGMLLPVPRSVRGSRPAAAGRRSTYPPTVCVS